MGQTLSRFFQSGSALLSVGNPRGVSDDSRNRILTAFEILHANPKTTLHTIETLLSPIPKNENILSIRNIEGYNLLQVSVGVNNVPVTRWLLTRNPDLNRGACSYPLHIACINGSIDSVEELIRHGARIDVEAKLCWPGPHTQTCEERGKFNVPEDHMVDSRVNRFCDKLQNALYYAIDADDINVLHYLLSVKEEHSSSFTPKKPLLHVAIERGCWKSTKFLVTERPEEINMCYDEYYPIHHAVLREMKYLSLLIANHALTTVVTATEQMTLLHLLFLIGRKSAEETLTTTRLLLDNGLRELINAPDSLGNTPLHGLIVRYALEEARYGYHHENQPWNKWEMMLLVRYLLQNGARPSINQPGNSALAYVLRHVKDWEFRYDLLHMLLQDGGDPNIAGRDGSVPLMVCLVPLINKDPLYHFTHSMKVCYLNCVRILCKHGANPNCSSRSNLTPLHVLVFTASENIPLSREEEKALNFEFIRNLLILLLQYGLDPNVGVSQRTPHILQSIVEMVKNTRTPADLNDVYDLILTLIQYGADPNVNISSTNNGPMIFCYSQPNHFVKIKCKHVLGYYVHLVSKKELFLLDPFHRFARILDLFHMCMNHSDLYGCLRLSFAQQSGLVPSKGSQILCNTLKDMFSKPRSLKQICRVSIYESLHRKPGVYVNKLPLPNVLKDYLMNFEP